MKTIALLRAVNVGGTGKLPMAELKAMAEELGFENAQTYIASGNLIFASDASEDAIREKLDRLIEQEAGKRLGVVVRSAGKTSDAYEVSNSLLFSMT